jgi:hypothetical protein
LTGNGNRNLASGAGRRNMPDLFGIPTRLAIALSVAVARRNSATVLPEAVLERSCTHVDGQL